MDEGDKVAFPLAKDGDVESNGYMREYLKTIDEAGGIQTKEVWLEV